MKNNIIKQIILESVRQAINESFYRNTTTPHVSKAEAQRELGSNPLRTDVGNHSAHDEVGQPSTTDEWGANFDGEHFVVSDNRFTFYKVKNFGSPNVKDTKSLFGSEKELRKAIDIVNGAAERNKKFVKFRTITSDSFQKLSEKTSYMSNTFWEFSYGGGEWYILKPNPVQTLKISKFNP